MPDRELAKKPKSKAPADPHPSDEEHYDRIEWPGGARPLGKDIGPNPAVHTGRPEPKPQE
jgi:hypothetical protein